MAEGEKKVNDTDQPAAGWQFKGDNTSMAAPQPARSDIRPIEWSASEFIEHSKSSSWYLLLGVGGVALAAVVYLLTKDKVSAIMIIIVVAVFGVFASRRPRVLNYSVNSTGITIGGKIYSYGNFKSFSVVREGNVDSIWFMPLKRFMPTLTIYFEPNDEPKIVEAISQFLPVEAHQLDAVDKLMHRLRF